jgi:hypothetical protein
MKRKIISAGNLQPLRYLKIIFTSNETNPIILRIKDSLIHND